MSGHEHTGRCALWLLSNTHPMALAEHEVVIERTAIGSNRIRCQTEVRLNLQPRLRMLHLGNEWVAIPLHIGHGQLLSLEQTGGVCQQHVWAGRDGDIPPPSAAQRIPRRSPVSRPSPTGASLRYAALTRLRLRGTKVLR